MERDVVSLRCSKLNCYAEFNKMVQSLARCKHLTVQTVPWAKKMLGTSAEYTFYATLLTMLQQVISNNKIDSQKQELQRVYEWFKFNKPLLKMQKEIPTEQKPKLVFTSRSNTSVASVDKPLLQERPQTAPASLHEPSRRNSSVGEHRTKSRPMTSFTSAYVSRSFGHSIDSIGQTFDQLESVRAAIDKRPPSQDTQGSKPSRSCPSTAAKSPVEVSIQAHPSPDFLSDYTPPGFGGVQPHMAESICFGEVFSFAPPVAAQMILSRTLPPEDYEERELAFLRRLLQSKVSRKPPKNLAHRFTTKPQTKNSPVDVSPQSVSDLREMQSYSDTILSIVPPPSSPDLTRMPTFSSSVPHRAQQSNGKTTMADRGQDTYLLETIAEADLEMPPSSERGRTGRVFKRPEEGAETSVVGESVLAEDLSLDSTYEPRVSITSNAITGTSSSHTNSTSPTRYPSVVSLTFPEEKEPLSGQQTTRVLRKPKRSFSTASMKNKRNTRPQTVPAMKIQSYSL